MFCGFCLENIKVFFIVGMNLVGIVLVSFDLPLTSLANRDSGVHEKSGRAMVDPTQNEDAFEWLGLGSGLILVSNLLLTWFLFEKVQCLC